jgi:hypothetical protein
MGGVNGALNEALGDPLNGVSVDPDSALPQLESSSAVSERVFLSITGYTRTCDFVCQRKRPVVLLHLATVGLLQTQYVRIVRLNVLPLRKTYHTMSPGHLRAVNFVVAERAQPRLRLTETSLGANRGGSTLVAAGNVSLLTTSVFDCRGLNLSPLASQSAVPCHIV